MPLHRHRVHRVRRADASQRDDRGYELKVGRALLFLSITAVAFAALFFVHSLPSYGMRALHVIFFAAWVWSLSSLLHAMGFADARKITIVTGIVAAAVGELIQFWFPAHQVEWHGFAASLVGVLCGSWLARGTAVRST